MITAQREDSFLNEIYRKLQLLKPEERFLQGKTEFVLKNDLIHKITRGVIPSVYIPENIAYSTISFIHAAREHVGAERLVLILNKSNIFVEKKYKIIKKVIKNCMICQFRKPESPDEAKKLQ